ncbi:MAG: serine dehydratase, partial [Clostridia bacterium]|nr:serine dehydratase [Clostridia bacterium]
MKSIKNIYKIGYGPSSSHTMGPAFAATAFCARDPAADRMEVTLQGSLAKTGRGHGTDRAVAGVLA